MDKETDKGSWWKTLPGILSGIAGVLAAVTGLIVALSQSGLFGEKNSKPGETLPSSQDIPTRESPSNKNDTANSGPSSPISGTTDANKLLRGLQKANIRNSVGDNTMLEWLSDSDAGYRQLAKECLRLIGNRRLARDGIDLDKVNYYYLQLLGLGSEDAMPIHHSIDTQKLARAMINAYNNRNGANATLLPEIVE